MRPEIKEWMENCCTKLREGDLQERDLQHVVALLTPPKQMVLYLYSKSTNMRSAIAAWALYDPTKPEAPELPSQEAPYPTVLEAVRDGWRIVQFPRPELYGFSEIDNDYLGFEFILEKCL